MKTLIVAALPQEFGDHFTDLANDILFVGVGKVNATYAMTRELMGSGRGQYDRVVNLGTAGSPDVPPGTLVVCEHLVQGDMNCQALGSEPGLTPFEADPYPKNEPWLRAVNPLPGTHFTDGHWRTYCSPDGKPGVVTCITRDTFVQMKAEKSRDWVRTEVLDMEAWALARVCQRHGIPFTCVKYVTDSGASSAAAEWKRHLPLAGPALRAAYDRIVS